MEKIAGGIIMLAILAIGMFGFNAGVRPFIGDANEAGFVSEPTQRRMRIKESLSNGDTHFHIIEVDGQEYLTQTRGGFIKLDE